jgi:hypothetical protein
MIEEIIKNQQIPLENKNPEEDLTFFLQEQLQLQEEPQE